MVLGLSDGRRALIRPIAPDDEALLREGLERLSPESVRRGARARGRAAVMTRAATVLALAGLLAACGGADKASGPAGIADVVVRVDPDGPNGPKPAQRMHLVCTKPQQSQACGAAAGISASDLRPTPKGVACTDIYGGPQTATIVGVIRGDGVNARFSRTNGCEIKRWNGVSDLLNLVP